MARAGGAVLSNSRTELTHGNEPATPSKKPSTASNQGNFPITPQSNSKAGARLTSDPGLTALTPFQKTARDNPWLNVSDDEIDDSDLKNLADEADMPPPETPSKLPQLKTPSSLGKRRLDGVQIKDEDISSSDLSFGSDPFVTPNAKFQKRDANTSVGTSTMTGPGSLMTPGDTQRTGRVGPSRSVSTTTTPSTISQSSTSRDESPLSRKSTNFLDSSSVFAQASSKDQEPPLSELATEVLDNLRDLHVELSIPAVTAVKAIAHRYVVKTKAIEKGRDVSREAIRRRDARIRELEEEVTRLKGLGGQMTK